MTRVFTLKTYPLTNAGDLEAQWGDAVTWHPVASGEALSTHAGETGVVLLSGSPDKVFSQIAAIRQTAPLLSCLVVLTPEEADLLSPSQLMDADVLLSSASPAESRVRLQNMAQLSDLRRLVAVSAQVDEETGLYNQGYFIKRLGEEIALSRRHKSPVTCVILGVSYYEVYVDSYGYAFATSVMQHVADIAQEQVRREDIIARLSNSEIAFLLPRSTEKGAEILTKRVVEAIEAQPHHTGDQVEHLHASAGIAAFPILNDDSADAEGLIRYARHALHQAKCSDDVTVQCFSQLKPFVG